MTGPAQHSRPTPDFIPPWGRVLLYVLAILAPAAAVVTGVINNTEAITVFLTIAGVLGPVVAIGYTVKTEQEKPAHYRAGFTDALEGRPDPDLAPPDMHDDER